MKFETVPFQKFGFIYFTESLLKKLFSFSRKMFLMLHFINWPNVILWLPLLFEVLDNFCIVITVSQIATLQILKLTLAF